MIKFLSSVLFVLLVSSAVAVGLQWGAEARAQGNPAGGPLGGPDDGPGGGEPAPCKAEACKVTGTICYSGFWCTTATCKKSDGTYGDCSSTSDSEQNDLFWWCPFNTWVYCYCEDGCAPLGIFGLGGLARGLSAFLSSTGASSNL